MAAASAPAEDELSRKVTILASSSSENPAQIAVIARLMGA
jgi:hypothetical protein